MTESLDPSVVRAAAGGDRSAFDQLVQRWSTAVSSIALAATRDPAAADDVAQEAFLKAWRNLPKLRDPAAFGGWLRRIARTEAAEYLRRPSRRLTLSEEAVSAAAGEDPEAALERREQVRLLASAVDAAPPDCREVLVLYYRQGCSIREVAGLLGLSEAAAKKRLSRARAQLRDDVEAAAASLLGGLGTAAIAERVSRGVAGTTQVAGAGLAKGLLTGLAVAAVLLGGLQLARVVYVASAPKDSALGLEDLLESASPPPREPASTAASSTALLPPPPAPTRTTGARPSTPSDTTQSPPPFEDVVADALRALPDDWQDIHELAIECDGDDGPCVLSGHVADPKSIPRALRALASELLAREGAIGQFMPLPLDGAEPIEGLQYFAIQLGREGSGRR